MILSEQLPWDDEEWREILRNSIRDTATLRTELRLKTHEALWIDNPTFKILVPRPYLARIEPGNPKDPLLLQVAPSVNEANEVAGYTTDPLSERNSIVAPGVLQKYSGRLLYIIASACPIHCRYCFRRHFPYSENRSVSFEPLLDVLNKDKTISEVILSGGDPLILSDDRLRDLVLKISSVSHVRVLRFHTRFGVAVPQRITRKLLEILSVQEIKVVVVMHVNHTNEIDNNVELAIESLKEIGVTLLNQSVLLKGVNDSASVLEQLSWKLFRLGVLPYYLHLLDKVAGTSHFDLPEKKALSIFRTLQSSVPGYLAPRLVREVSGRESKIIIGSSMDF